ncbi:hypothetical protein [Microbacterium timonense]|uniref:hypothetical protein n=1 Tax=Microbacterium timonense TaxID=2086576 RepID=UPI000D10D6DF|nr:hypothetical protein [Microbacterium timonense]
MADSAEWDAADAADSAPLPSDGGTMDLDWGQGEELVDDDSFVNAFTDEIAGITASDWDVDADVLWGDDVSPDLGADPGAAGYDFPM